MVITVSNTADLYKALSACKGGETILLTGGQYGSLNINPYMKPPVNMDFPSTVTIASADINNPAVFSKADVREISNLTIDGVTFDYTFKPGDRQDGTPFVFSSCDGLTIKDSTFDGDEAYGMSAASNGYGFGIGLRVRDSANAVIEGNESYNFYRGMSFDGNKDLTVRDNDLHSMRMDGMTFLKAGGVVIEDNYIHDFRGSPTSGDHCDMIQFWTSGTTTPSTDIIIRGNVLDIGNGTFTQSIFMGNEVVSANQAMFGTMAYRNVTIENNTIVNGHQLGINVDSGAGVTVRHNTVVHADGGNVDGWDHPVEIPAISVSSKSTNVSVTDNITSNVTGYSGQAGWSVGNNIFVQDQDPLKPGYYGDIFVQSSLQAGVDGRHEYVAREGSDIDRLNTGSAITRPEGQGLQIIFHVEDINKATRIFDASPSRSDGAELPSGTTYKWSFGDGTTASGQVVSHSYTAGGDYQVRLTVTLPKQGFQITEAAAVPVEGAEIVTMNSTGQFTAYEQGEAVALGAGKTASVDGLQLGAPGTSATVARSHVVDVVSSDAMFIAFSLETDKAGSSGELFRLHGSFAASVTKSGELQVQLMRDGTSTVWLTTKGASLNAILNQEHDVVINLEDGQLQAWVDGKLNTQVPVSGVVGGATGFGSHSLVFGNPWSGANFRGDLSAFELSVGAGDFPTTPKTAVLAPGTLAMSDLQMVDATVDEPVTMEGDAATAEMHALMDTHEGHAILAMDVESLQTDEAPQSNVLDGSHDRFVTMLDERLDVYAA